MFLKSTILCLDVETKDKAYTAMWRSASYWSLHGEFIENTLHR